MDPRNAKKLAKGKSRGVVRRQTQPAPQFYRPEMGMPPPQQYYTQGYHPQFDTSQQYYSNQFDTSQQYYSNQGTQGYRSQFDPYEPRYDNLPNEDDDDEIIPETQPNTEPDEEEEEEQEVEEVAPPVQKKNWTSEEEEALAKAWVKISVDKEVGDRQKRVGFWTRVTKHFKTLIDGSVRTHDQLCSKWKNMNAAMMVFNGLYTQLIRVQKSGCSEINVFEKALEDYRRQQLKPFNHVKAWRIVQDYPKWMIHPLVGEESAGSNKKRKSSDSTGWDNQNPSNPIDDLLPNLNDDPCPTRQNKGKKKVGEEASSQVKTSSVLKEYADKKLHLIESTVTNENVKQEKYMALLDEQRDYVEKQKSFVLGEKLKSDIEFLSKPHDNMSEHMQKIVLMRKRQICEENGWPCEF